MTRARIDYWGIEQKIAQVLKAAPELVGVDITVEKELSFQRGPIVIIYLDQREVPIDQQTLSANTRARQVLTFSIWCWHFALEVADGMRKRDDLLGKLELVLMNDDTFGDTVEASWLAGGQFMRLENAEGDGLMAGAECRLVVVAVGTTE